MSFVATTWALKIGGVQDATSRVILLGLAEHAHEDGSSAWPSVATLAKYAVCSERTVHRRLRELEEAGMIRRGDQQLVAHLPSNRRPIVYDLPVGVTVWHTSRDDIRTGVSPEAARGDTPGTSGVTAVADKPSLEPSIEPSSSSSAIDEPGQRKDVETVCAAIAAHVVNVTGKEPFVGTTWRRDARLMLDTDGHSVEQILNAITWVSRHGFWAGNIRSPGKLRLQWWTLVGQASQDRAPKLDRAAETLLRDRQRRQEATQASPLELTR